MHFLNYLLTERAQTRMFSQESSRGKIFCLTSSSCTTYIRAKTSRWSSLSPDRCLSREVSLNKIPQRLRLALLLPRYRNSIAIYLRNWKWDVNAHPKLLDSYKHRIFALALISIRFSVPLVLEKIYGNVFQHVASLKKKYRFAKYITRLRDRNTTGQRNTVFYEFNGFFSSICSGFLFRARADIDFTRWRSRADRNN